MIISVKDTTVFAVFHPDAQDLYNTCSDLKKVARGLWDPDRRLGDEVSCSNLHLSIADYSKGKRAHLFRAFAPMLCRRPTQLEDSVKEMQGKTFFIEEKLDGERMQLHKRGDEFFYCSRYVCECLSASLTFNRGTGKEKTTRIFTGGMQGPGV
jgi:DNA ligase-4